MSTRILQNAFRNKNRSTETWLNSRAPGLSFRDPSFVPSRHRCLLTCFLAYLLILGQCHPALISATWALTRHLFEGASMQQQALTETVEPESKSALESRLCACTKITTAVFFFLWLPQRLRKCPPRRGSSTEVQLHLRSSQSSIQMSYNWCPREGE